MFQNYSKEIANLPVQRRRLKHRDVRPWESSDRHTPVKGSMSGRKI